MKTVMMIMCWLNYCAMCLSALGAIWYAWTGNIIAGLTQALVCVFFGIAAVCFCWSAK